MKLMRAGFQRMIVHAVFWSSASIAGLPPAVAAEEHAVKAAEPAKTAESGLEEIVVTAQKREENLQSVPIAVAAITVTQSKSSTRTHF